MELTMQPQAWPAGDLCGIMNEIAQRATELAGESRQGKGGMMSLSAAFSFNDPLLRELYYRLYLARGARSPEKVMRAPAPQKP